MIARVEPTSIGVFGGSFNPPHVGHVLAAAYALALGFERVVVVPVFAHAFDKVLAAFADRLRMCELAFAGLRSIEVCAIERQLGAPSRTLRTLQALSREHPNRSMRLIIGADVLREVHKWYAFEEVVKLAPPFILGRRGVGAGDSPEGVLPAVSSTEVRAWLSVSDDGATRRLLEAAVPRAVLEYVREKGLYC